MKLLLALIVAFAAFPATAGETGWVEVMPSVSLRLVSSDTVTDQGVVWMGLEFDMPAKTKTYWRVPGESGIPLVVDWSGSDGVEDMEIAWPYPVREVSEDYLDHAYYGRVLIPFAITIAGTEAHLAADITLGICSDVCVPVALELALPVRTDAPNSANGLRIRQALAQVPLSYDNAGPFGEAVFDLAQKAMILDWTPGAIDPETIIAELDGTMLVFDMPEVVEEGNALKFALLGRLDPDIFTDGAARFTFDTPEGPFEIVRPLGVR